MGCGAFNATRMNSVLLQPLPNPVGVELDAAIFKAAITLPYACVMHPSRVTMGPARAAARGCDVGYLD